MSRKARTAYTESRTGDAVTITGAKILGSPATHPIRNLAGTPFVTVEQDDSDRVFFGDPNQVCFAYLCTKRSNDPFKKGGGPI